MEWKGSMTAVRRSEGPRLGGTDGERTSRKTTKIPSRWSGGYRDKYGCTRKGGGGGRRETGTAEIERAIERSIRRHATRATTGDEPRDSRPLRGAPSPRHCKNREGTRASEAGTLTGRRLATRRETQDHCGGRRLLSPSTNTRSKYCQPHRSRGGHAHNHRVTGKDNRSSMAPAASQFRADSR